MEVVVEDDVQEGTVDLGDCDDTPECPPRLEGDGLRSGAVRKKLPNESG